MKTTLKELRQFVRTGVAIDVTTADKAIINGIMYNRVVGKSHGSR